MKQPRFSFTSHNITLLGDKELTRRDCIWITDRNADGSSSLSSVWDYNVRKEYAVEKLFQKGLIGGRPKLRLSDIEDEHDEA